MLSRSGDSDTLIVTVLISAPRHTNYFRITYSSQPFQSKVLLAQQGFFTETPVFDQRDEIVVGFDLGRLRGA